MVTGIETAGLVLGSIPLILASLQFYAEGINVTKRYWKYKEEINSLIVDLRAENCQYINTINWLLIGVVNQTDMAIFLADPGGERWKDEHFDRKLKNRLGNSFTSYLETITQLMTISNLFKERLKLNSSGKAQFSDNNTFKEHYRRLRFSLNKNDYKDLMDRLRQANQRLYRMTVQTSHMAAHQASMRPDRQCGPNFRVIKDRAQSFHFALSKGWNCTCEADHIVSLRLEPRMEDIQNEDDEEGEESMREPFHVLFRYTNGHSPNACITRPWTWDEADVQVEYESHSSPDVPASSVRPGRGVKFAKREIPKAIHAALEPQPNLQPIQDLCAAISTLQKPQRDVCFSLLANEIARRKYGVLITPIKKMPLDTDMWSISSLGAVLDDPNFAQKDRLKLAVTLASSILQLHETPWLEEDLGKENIFFINRSGKTLYDQPFVSQQFNQATAPATSRLPSNISCVIRNQTLYALGVALIELWYRKAIGDLHENIDGPLNTGNDLFNLMTEFKTADRLSDELYSEAGAKYSDVVRRCIRCDFDKRASSLKDTQFQKVVYEKVVAQLQDNYDYLFQHDPE